MGSCFINFEWNALRYDPGRMLCKSKLKNSVQLQTVGFVWSRNGSKQRRAEFFTIEDCCETSYWSDDENSKLQSLERDLWNGDESPRVKKETKPTLRAKCEGVFVVASVSCKPSKYANQWVPGPTLFFPYVVHSPTIIRWAFSFQTGGSFLDLSFAVIGTHPTNVPKGMSGPSNSFP